MIFLGVYTSANDYIKILYNVCLMVKYLGKIMFIRVEPLDEDTWTEETEADNACISSLSCPFSPFPERLAPGICYCYKNTMFKTVSF